MHGPTGAGPAVDRRPFKGPARTTAKPIPGRGFARTIRRVLDIAAPAHRKPDWLKVRLPGGETYHEVKRLVNGLGLATVCEEARCPNIAECWGGGTMTIMLMGDTCTRACRFCHVKTAKQGEALDPFEPHKVAMTVSQLGLEYVVLTMVDRDDLPDQGAAHVAKTIRNLKERDPKLTIEVLTGDFKADRAAIATVVQDGAPDVFAHNVETVARLTPSVRDRKASYAQSLHVLRLVKELDPSRFTKSSLMLGLGEQPDEVEATMRDLREADVDILTFGQYLQPSPKHLPVQRYVPPAEFDAWAAKAKGMGFLYCASGPLVRSSYKAGELFVKALIEQRRTEP